MSIALLNGLRVVDAATGEAAFCGYLLGVLGAEVVKVEPNGGDPGRGLPPFAYTPDGTRVSLLWSFLNANKRQVRLDVEEPHAQAELLNLLREADVFVESYPAGYLARLGLDERFVERSFPKLVHTTITPFGQDGPGAGRPASDLTLMALSGYLHNHGYPDRPPNRVSVDQAYLVTAAEAAAGTMMALMSRERTESGQRVDVAALDTMISVFSRNAITRYQATRETTERAGAETMQILGYTTRRSIFRCADGDINFQILGGVNTRFVQNLADWMKDCGWQGEAAYRDWLSYTYGSLSLEEQRRLEDDFEAFFMTKTTDELVQASAERGLLIYPISRPTQVVRLTPLVESGLFVEDEFDGVRVTRPGPFFHSNRLSWSDTHGE